MSQQKLHIYTDGGSAPTNPGPGGWAVVIAPRKSSGEEPTILSGAEPDTTNNIMELTAMRMAMRWMLQTGNTEAVIYSDSQYCINVMQSWAAAWEKRGWTKKGGDIKNLDLIKDMLALSRKLQITWQWVRGHSGNHWNERADQEVHKARFHLLAPEDRRTDPPAERNPWPVEAPTLHAALVACRTELFYYMNQLEALGRKSSPGGSVRAALGMADAALAAHAAENAVEMAGISTTAA